MIEPASLASLNCCDELFLLIKNCFVMVDKAVFF